MNGANAFDAGRQRGVTLVELMVALVVGLVMTLAIFSVMSTFEGRRRTLGSTADIEQSGSVAMYVVDRWVRGAGSGLDQGSSYLYGCELLASKSGQQLLPATSALPAPFAHVNPGTAGVFRLAPAMILPNQTTPGASGGTSDVLLIMSSGASGGQVPTLFTDAAQATQLSVPNTLAFGPSDLVLVADQQQSAAGSIAPCMVTQASSSATSGIGTTLPLAGAWQASTIASTALANYSDTGVAYDLGNVDGGHAPSFLVVGVGDNDTLYSYDLLGTSSTPLQARAEGVFELHALYGVDTNNDGKVDTWVSPASGSYTLTTLADGTTTAAGLLKNIRALRVGLILRTALPEKSAVNAATSVTMFTDLGTSLTFTRALSAAEQRYRYRTVEATIPLRNNAF